MAGHGLESKEIPAADCTEDRVVGEAGAVGDLVGGEDVADGLRRRRGWPGVLFVRVGRPDDDRVWFVSHGAQAIVLSHAVYHKVLLLTSNDVQKVILPRVRGRGSTQHDCCVVIPSFDENGNLPPGIHLATWDEIVERYATNERRGQLLDGLRAAIESPHAAGCTRLYLDGSFVTDKKVPGDFDACWEAGSVDPGLLDPVLLDFRDRRSAQKAKFGGELFPAQFVAGRGGTTFLEFFQLDRLTQQRKGIIAIDLEAWA